MPPAAPRAAWRDDVLRLDTYILTMKLAACSALCSVALCGSSASARWKASAASRHSSVASGRIRVRAGYGVGARAGGGGAGSTGWGSGVDLGAEPTERSQHTASPEVALWPARIGGDGRVGGIQRGREHATLQVDGREVRLQEVHGTALLQRLLVELGCAGEVALGEAVVATGLDLLDGCCAARGGGHGVRAVTETPLLFYNFFFAKTAFHSARLRAARVRLFATLEDLPCFY